MQLLPAQPAPVRRRSAFRRWLPTVRFGLVCFGIWLALRTVAPSYAIEGDSMYPTFHDGGRVVLNGTHSLWTPTHGDVVVFEPPIDASKPFIKRIIGLPNDQIDIVDGQVWRNGELLDEPYIANAATNCLRDVHCSLIVPEGQVFVMGDNRQNSTDSRIFGPVDIDDVVGEVLFTFWPLSDVP